MPPKPLFRDDPYVSFTRKCLVFPSEGSEPRLVDMPIRTVTHDDISRICFCNRTVDLAVLYGNEHHKTRVWRSPEYVLCKYLLYFNMSPKLPVNRCVARIADVDPDGVGSRLFWRGDVVVMKYEPLDEIFIDCQNADISLNSDSEDTLRDVYMTGRLEQELNRDKEICKWEQRFRRAPV